MRVDDDLMQAIETALTCINEGNATKAAQILYAARAKAKKPPELIDPRAAQAAAEDMHRLAVGIKS